MHKTSNRWLIQLFFLHCTKLAFASACSKVTTFNNRAVGHRVLFHSRWCACLFFSLIIDSNKKNLTTVFVACV